MYIIIIIYYIFIYEMFVYELASVIKKEKI